MKRTARPSVRRWCMQRRARRWSVVHPDTGRPMGYTGNIVSTPPPWCALRLAVRLSKGSSPIIRCVRLLAIVLFVTPQYWFANVPAVRFSIQFGSATAFIVTLVAFWMDIKVREEQAINSAWQLISSAKDTNVGNIGVVSALELLARKNIALTDVRLPGAFLRRLELTGANLGRAQFGVGCINSVLQQRTVRPGEPDNFTHRAEWIASLERDSYFSGIKLTRDCCKVRQTDVLGSILHHSNLIHSTFVGANLRNTDFTGSCLFAADLSGADLSRANFDYTILRNAKLKGALLGDTSFAGADLVNADFRLTVCHKPGDRNRKYRICTREDIEGLVKGAASTCGIKFPGDTDLSHLCKNSGIVNCTEAHGYNNPRFGLRSDGQFVPSTPLTPDSPTYSCAVERCRHPAGANPARQLSLQPVAIGAVEGGNDFD